MHFAAAKDSPLLVGNLSMRQNGVKLPFHERGEEDFLSFSRARVSLPFSRGILKVIRRSYRPGNLRVAVRDTPAKCHGIALTPDQCTELYHIVRKGELVKMPRKQPSLSHFARLRDTNSWNFASYRYRFFFISTFIPFLCS